MEIFLWTFRFQAVSRYEKGKTNTTHLECFVVESLICVSTRRLKDCNVFMVPRSKQSGQ